MNPKVKADKARAAKSSVENNERRSDEALRHIVALIFEGHLSPGTRLPAERELAESLGVSRATLRDAVNRLEARGYIERRSKSGNYVSTAIPQSVSDPINDVVDTKVVGFTDIIEIRKVLELWAVEKASESPSKDSLKRLEQCLKTMRATATLRTDEQFIRHSVADLRFHQVIAEMAKNPIYVHLFHFFTNLISRSISLSRQLVPGNFGEQNIAVHEQIFDAVKQADAVQARQAILDHFKFVEQHLYKPKNTKRQTSGTPKQTATPIRKLV